MIINVDSDGVVFDMVGILTRRSETKLGRDLPAVTSWDFKNWGSTPAEIRLMFEDEARQNLFGMGAAIPGAVDGIFRLVNAGHQVRIVTNKGTKALGRGSKNAMQDTVQWYYGIGLLGVVDLVFVEGGKQGYPADVVVDDKPDMSWAQADAVNILFHQPWNQATWSPPESDRVWYRAVGWREVLELVEQMGGGILIDKSPVVY
jgi:5' nucleotidase, deoxy (Pyrimidine), cytosolic type C protein (NT5C)